MYEEPVDRTRESRDYRKRLDLKEVDARGHRLTEDFAQRTETEAVSRKDDKPESRPEWLRMDGGQGERGTNERTVLDREDELHSRLNRLEDLVRESLGQRKEISAAKISGRKTMKASGKSTEKGRHSELARSNSLGKKSQIDTMKTSSNLQVRPLSKNDPRLENEYVSKVRDSNFVLAKELGMKHAESEKLRSTVQARDMELGKASNGIERLGMREDRLLQEIELLKQENKLLEDRNIQLRVSLQSVQQDRQGEGFLLLENQTLKDDIIRLIKMLQNTKEVELCDIVQELCGLCRC